VADTRTGRPRTARHGTRSMYTQHRCRCEPCTIANRLYARNADRRRRDIEYGFVPKPPPALIDATEVRQHLRWLSANGVGRRTVATVTGMSNSAIAELASGRRTMTTRRTADRILAVGLLHRADGSDGARVDSAPVRAMVAELVDLGWSKSALARMLGYRSRALQFADRPTVNPATARRVKALHAALTARARQRTG
jgi:hypothetical protein